MNNSTPFPKAEENGVGSQIVAAIFIASAIFGTIGNSFVIVAVCLSRKIRTTTNVFVVNLAVADVVTCLVAPWQAVAVLGGQDWPLPKATWVCTAVAFVIVVTVGCSVNNLALISVNRWVGITKSRFTTRRIYTTRKLALMVIISWAIPLGCALTPVLTNIGELGYERLYKICSWVKSNPRTDIYSLVIAGIYYPIQLITIATCYISIFRYVRKTSQETMEAQQQNHATRTRIYQRQLDVTKNLLYVVLAFLLCNTPCFVALIISSEWIYPFVSWSAAIVFCNSSVNPIIYATSHPDFKEVVGHLIRCRRVRQRNLRPRAGGVYAISVSSDQRRSGNEDHRL